MRLDQVLHEVPVVDVVGRRDADVPLIAFDSRKVTPGSMYVAVSGTQTDGHAHIDASLVSGATVIVCERRPDRFSPDATYVVVPSSSQALGLIASNFHGRPSSELVIVGITGTNGKTTTVTLLHQISQMLGIRSGLFSTILNLIADEPIQSPMHGDCRLTTNCVPIFLCLQATSHTGGRRTSMRSPGSFSSASAAHLHRKCRPSACSWSPETMTSIGVVAESELSHRRTFNEATVAKMLTEGGQLWEAYVRRLRGYREYVRDAYPHLLSNAPRLSYAIAFAVHDLNVAVCGFN